VPQSEWAGCEQKNLAIRHTHSSKHIPLQYLPGEKRFETIDFRDKPAALARYIDLQTSKVLPWRPYEPPAGIERIVYGLQISGCETFILEKLF
jgi:hypothetical protein